MPCEAHRTSTVGAVRHLLEDDESRLSAFARRTCWDSRTTSYCSKFGPAGQTKGRRALLKRCADTARAVLSVPTVPSFAASDRHLARPGRAARPVRPSGTSQGQRYRHCGLEVPLRNPSFAGDRSGVCERVSPGYFTCFRCQKLRLPSSEAQRSVTPSARLSGLSVTAPELPLRRSGALFCPVVHRSCLQRTRVVGSAGRSDRPVHGRDRCTGRRSRRTVGRRYGLAGGRRCRTARQGWQRKDGSLRPANHPRVRPLPETATRAPTRGDRAR